MAGDLFKNTMFGSLCRSIEEAYGRNEGAEIYREACKILAGELGKINSQSSKSEINLLKTRILPGYACYIALISSGVPSEEAVSFTEKVICKNIRQSIKKSGVIKYMPFMFGLLGIILGRMVKQYDSIYAGTYFWDERSKNRIAFHCKKCFYYDELLRKDVPELCRAFCATDAVAAEPLLPKVVFKRNGTLATGDQCDFCYEKAIR